MGILERFFRNPTSGVEGLIIPCLERKKRAAMTRPAPIRYLDIGLGVTALMMDVRGCNKVCLSSEIYTRFQDIEAIV